MRRLLHFFKGYGRECILGPFFKLLEASFELLVPLVMASIVDDGIAAADRGRILGMCGLLVLLAAIGLSASITAQFFAARAATGFSARLRSALFDHIERLSFTRLDSLGSSTLITRMTSDVNQVQNGVNMVLRLFLRSPFVVLGAVFMAFLVDAGAAWIFVVTIPLLSLVIFGVMVLTMPMYKKVQQGLDRLLGHTGENLEGVRVIRAFNRQQEEMERFEGDNRYLTGMQILVGRLSGLTNPLTYIIINVATLVVISFGAKSVYMGGLTQGQVIALVNYMAQILVELVKLANLIVTVTKALACADRIADMLDIPEGMEATAGAISAASGGKIGVEKAFDSTSTRTRDAVDNLKKPADQPQNGPITAPSVRFSHVSMTYSGALAPALADLSFEAEKGETIGIIGGTGSGKSTLVHLIPRFYDVSRGSVFVDGRDVRDYDLKELRSKVGIVMQRSVLFSGTIEENLRWGNEDADKEQMWRAIEMAQAADVVEGKAEGLSYEIQEGGKNLSGGQRQRLTIARALVKDPEILILDDSSSALDFATDARLRQALNAVQDKIVFLVSQRTSSVQRADKIIVLDDGQVVGIGKHEQLLASCPVYREIHESQISRTEQTGEGGRSDHEPDQK